MNKETQITQLEKRARGFRRIISALNDLPMYGINRYLDKILHVKIDSLKDHLKLKITKNNEKLNEMYTESIDSLADDDGQHGDVGYKPQPIRKSEPIGESFTSKSYEKRTYKNIKDHGTDISFENEKQQTAKNNHNQDI